MTTPLAILGRYALFDPIATGGMATVHLGLLLGPAGFSRTVAIKRLHAHLCRSPDFVAMFLDEAHLAARVQHPNVVPPIDIIEADGELFLVMEYVHGVSLSYLLREARVREELLPPAIAVNVVIGALRGLHAAHMARSERGEPLALVHRDVSPPNILVGVDGVTRVVDFGVAKATERQQTTRQGELKGKLSYMSPEQLEGGMATGQSDVFAAAVCLWESLTGQRLFQGSSDAELVERILVSPVAPPSSITSGLPAGLDDIVMCGLARAPEDRYESAQAMASELERIVGLLPPEEIGAQVRTLARGILQAREEMLTSIESESFSPESVRTVMARLSLESPQRGELETLPSGSSFLNRSSLTPCPSDPSTSTPGARASEAPSSSASGRAAAAEESTIKRAAGTGKRSSRLSSGGRSLPPGPDTPPERAAKHRLFQRLVAGALTCLLLLGLLAALHAHAASPLPARPSSLTPERPAASSR